jgi:uncharacterized membrane protein
MNDQINVADAERWASALGGAALAVWGLKRLRDERTPGAALIATAGASLIARGATGHCYVYSATGVNTADYDTRTALAGPRGVNVDEAVTIGRPAAELYARWRRLEDLPKYMSHLVSVTPIDQRRSRWVAKAPAGRTVEWEAEIINEIPNELIAWRTIGESRVVSAGSVHFKSAPGSRGTEVRVRLRYEPPGGKAGATIAWILGHEPSQTILEDLRRFRQLMETGEKPTTEGQPHGRRSMLRFA